MPLLLEQMQELAPEIQFTAGDAFCWSPDQRLITYRKASLRKRYGQWSLLHEVAHGLLNHESYQTDFELLKLEVEAWDYAKRLGIERGIVIDEDHIQDCLDTYRDWLHRRSTCPTCGLVSLQHSAYQYACHNCLTVWDVTAARFCRPYRKKLQTTRHTAAPDKVDGLHPVFN